MLNPSASIVASHPNAPFWLDLADKLIKAIAVLVGGAWTWMNFSRSRTYAQKLDFQVVGNVFHNQGLYVDASIILKNLGASKHKLQSQGTYCEIVAILRDLSRRTIRIFPVFDLHTQIEPGESVNDHILWRIDGIAMDIIWLSVNLRVVSGEIEWNTESIVRVEPAS